MGSGGQLYSLSWGEFGSSLTSAVQLLRGHGDLVDVTLAAGGRSFPAHKIVLSAASPFLLDLLKSTPCQHPVVMLAGIGAEDLEILLEFVYRGEVSVESSQLPSLLQAAHSLSILGLTPPTILPDKGEETPLSTIASNNEPSVKETPVSLPGRRRKRRRKSSSTSSGKCQRTESTVDIENRRFNTNLDNQNFDFDPKDKEACHGEDVLEQRDSEFSHRGPSPSMIQAGPVNVNSQQNVLAICSQDPEAIKEENPQQQDPISDSEPPHFHTLMPMQPYSPLHIPQFPASLGIGFPPAPCVPQTQPVVAVPMSSNSSGKIRGASDCPGVCPLCGATLRQARNLRRHLLSSCKYRLNSYVGIGNQSPSEATMIEVKPEVNMTEFCGQEGFRIDENDSCEQIVCKPSPLPSPSSHGSSVVSRSNVPSPPITR